MILGESNNPPVYKHGKDLLLWLLLMALDPHYNLSRFIGVIRKLRIDVSPTVKAVYRLGIRSSP
jgi:hypothetical protein